MKKILLLLVGGTICTALNEEGHLAVSDRAAARLKADFEQSDSPFARCVQIDETENLHILSETMTVAKWELVRRTLAHHTAHTAYDGVIVAHGTDTLAFSAALFAQLLSDTAIPVFFVSACRPLSAADTNGGANFRAAVECICRAIPPNVYVPYRNPSDGRMLLHLGSRIRQCAPYTDDFYSAGALDITAMNEENYRTYFETLAARYPAAARRPLAATGVLRDCVLMIEPYVGMRYDAYDYGRFAAVLHGAYHAGTAAAESGTDYGAESILYMMDRCADCEPPVDTYMSPAVSRRGTYETVAVIEHHAPRGRTMRFLHGCTRETTYAKLLIAYSFMEDEAARAQYLSREHNFERICDKGE